MKTTLLVAWCLALAGCGSDGAFAARGSDAGGVDQGGASGAAGSPVGAGGNAATGAQGGLGGQGTCAGSAGCPSAGPPRDCGMGVSCASDGYWTCIPRDISDVANIPAGTSCTQTIDANNPQTKSCCILAGGINEQGLPYPDICNTLLWPGGRNCCAAVCAAAGVGS